MTGSRPGRRPRALALPCAALLASCAAPPAAHQLTVRATEYGYTMPDTVPAGLVRLTLHNDGHDLHEAMLVRFHGAAGDARAYVDSVRAGVDFPAFASDVGGAGLTLPGDSSASWLVLEPGRYALVCWKGDHLPRGMAHDLVVTPVTARTAPPPRATNELTLSDFAYTLDRPLARGRQVLHITNRGAEPHEADIFRLPGSLGWQAYDEWLERGEHGLPPLAPVGGIGSIVPGREVWLALDLEPGRYLIICQVPAAAGGSPHYALGMRHEFEVH